MTEPLETRLRQAMKLPDDAPDGMAYVSGVEAIQALGNILAEILAHLPEEAALDVLASISMCRRQWQAHPRVLEQLKPMGVA